MANRNRTAGHGWELKILKYLQPMFKHLVSSRSESGSRDAQKVDLINKDEWKHGRFPIDIQAKNVVGKMDIAKLVNEVKSANDITRAKRVVIFHKMTKKVGNVKSGSVRFMPVGEYAYCELSSLVIWLRLIKRWYSKAKQFDALKRHNEALREEVDELRQQVLRLIES